MSFQMNKYLFLIYIQQNHFKNGIIHHKLGEVSYSIKAAINYIDLLQTQ